MKSIKRLLLKFRLALAKRQLLYLTEHLRRNSEHMGPVELIFLREDIRHQENIAFGFELELIKLDLPDNETEALSNNSVSPMFRREL